MLFRQLCYVGNIDNEVLLVGLSRYEVDLDKIFIVVVIKFPFNVYAKKIYNYVQRILLYQAVFNGKKLIFILQIN